MRASSPKEGLSLSMWILRGLGSPRVPGHKAFQKTRKGIGAAMEGLESLPEKAPKALKKGRVWNTLFRKKVRTPLESSSSVPAGKVKHVLEEDLLRTSKVPYAAVKYLAVPTATFTGAQQIISSIEKKGDEVDEESRSLLLNAAEILRKCASEAKCLRAQLEIKDASIRDMSVKVAEATEKVASLEKSASARELADRMAQKGLISQSDVITKAASLESEEDLDACVKAVDMIESGNFSLGTLIEGDDEVKVASEELDPMSKLFMRHLGKTV
jgi:hypothetical protein